MKIRTVADKIKSNLIRPDELKNIRSFADKNNMLIKSIPLKDGTSAKILANAKELDCLIMHNGKVVASKGVSGKPKDLALILSEIYDHVMQKNRAQKFFNTEHESFDAINSYLIRFAKWFEE